jgi:hypothetical protein
MIGKLIDKFIDRRLWIWAAVAGTILGAFIFGSHASMRWLALLVAGLGALVLVQKPILGLAALILAALVLPLQFGTGTAVAINPATLLVPALLGLWLLDMVRQRDVHLVPSRTNRPLLLFLLAGLLSLLIGNAIWDPAVPREPNFIIVQLAQWAIFAFSAGAYWLMGNLVRDVAWLRRLTFLFLALAGGLAIAVVLPKVNVLANSIATFAVYRTPFWFLLASMAAGQLAFNRKLSKKWRWFLALIILAVLFYAFYLERATASNWIAVVAVLAVLAWLRFPRLRWPVIVLLVILVISGALTSAVYDFAGGDSEWTESGGSRLTLISRVIQVTMRNPITGLGPAAYRPYAGTEPLPYGGALWLKPQINSHNNYVDIFAHTGLLGLGLLGWFLAEAAVLGIRLRGRFSEGFEVGFINAMLAAGTGALVSMLFADWILPFVYNIGFPGFQASVLVWLFAGGLVALEQIAKREAGA